MSADIRKILVADDSKENRDCIESILKDLDVEIIQVESGEEALEKIKEIEPFLFILDSDMPGMDGYQVLNQLMTDEASRHTPVLLLTANLSDRQQSLHKTLLAVTDHLSKPVSTEKLVEKVKLFLELDDYRQAIKALHEDEEKVLETMHEGLMGIDAAGKIRYANSAALRLLRTDATQLIGIYLESIFQDPIHTVFSSWDEHPVSKVCREGNILQVEKSDFWRADGTKSKVKFAAVPVSDMKDLELVFAFRELDTEKDAKIKLAKLTNIDHLTGLPSRIRLEEALGEAILRAKRHNGHFAVLFIDLDHFKNINESLGHDMGDRVLKDVAERIRQYVRQTDTLARIGGDEFGIVLEGIDKPIDAGNAAQKILDCLREPFLIDGHEIFTGCSIGVATYPNCGDDVRTLLKNADSAAYRAKALGRSNYQYYTAEMNKQIIDRIEIEHDLHHALERNEFVIDYSPIVDVKSNTITGFEVLLSWHHPKRGVLEPEVFLPVAEDCGLIMPIGEWMIDEACKQIHESSKVDEEKKNYKLCFRVSPVHIVKPQFTSWLYQRVEEYELKGENLLIELCETVTMNRQQNCIDVLSDLHTMKVGLALAEFGMGYAPIDLLRHVPLDVIKLPDSLVSRLQVSETDRTILLGLIDLAHNLGLKVWASGVDNEAQLRFLVDNGADLVQGDIFSAHLVSGVIVESSVLKKNIAEKFASIGSR